MVKGICKGKSKNTGQSIAQLLTQKVLLVLACCLYFLGGHWAEYWVVQPLKVPTARHNNAYILSTCVILHGFFLAFLAVMRMLFAQEFAVPLFCGKLISWERGE